MISCCYLSHVYVINIYVEVVDECGVWLPYKVQLIEVRHKRPGAPVLEPSNLAVSCSTLYVYIVSHHVYITVGGARISDLISYGWAKSEGYENLGDAG